MSGPETKIVDHYDTGGLYDRIIAALANTGVSADAITADHLRNFDELHIGGGAATAALLDPLNIGPGTRVLDIGSGVGGPARFMNARYGADVTGIDLTPDFVATARKLTAHLGQTIGFQVGSALDMPFDSGSFDLATLLHVGMNLPDKPRLFAEVARVLKPGGRFAVYDVMRFGEHPQFPLPWATVPEASFLAEPEIYLAAADAAGFELLTRNDKGDMAREFFAEMQAKMAESGAPAVGLPLVMGEAAPTKVANMVAGVGRGDIAPVEMIFKHRDA